MIGGRLRVASYVNWAYGHGIPADEIYARYRDVDRAYNGTEDDLKQVVEAYNVTYVYVGIEEQIQYPQCAVKFDGLAWLEPVYNGSLRIYKVAF